MLRFAITPIRYLSTSPALLAVLNQSLDCCELSLGWRRLLGLGESSAGVTLALFDLFAPSEFTDLDQCLSAVFEQGDSLDRVPVTMIGAERDQQGFLTAWHCLSDDGQSQICLAVSSNRLIERAVSELNQLRSVHELIVSAAGEGIYGLDAQGCVTFGNAASMEILGWDPVETIGKHSHALHHHSHSDGSHYPPHECPIYAAINDGEVHRVDHEVFWHADGSCIPVEYTSTPIRVGEDITGAVVVFRDISARRRIEKQRQQAFNEITQLKEQLELERDYLRDEIKVDSRFGDIIGTSPALQHTMAQISAVAATPANVLILGESGVGKEMVARAIHDQSGRADKPLVKINCASIPKELFESEFFGHMRGAFTGAHRDRVGRLQLADGGTVFLDEVGEIPLDLQGKLLRALQEREFERVGDERTIKVDVRVVAATNRDLQADIAAGLFREDLFYRLSVFPIHVPPLRERKVDIALIAQHFLDRICVELGRDPIALSKHQAQRLTEHRWPGNIRELKNIIERAVILSQGNRARLDLALPLQANEPVSDAHKAALPATGEFVSDQAFRALEKANMLAVLQHTQWRVWGPDGAAAAIGIKASTFNHRMKVFGLKKPQ